MIAVAERDSLTISRKIDVPCHQCGGWVGQVRLDGAIPPGAATVRLKCPNRRCGMWNEIDVATGKAEAGRSKLIA